MKHKPFLFLILVIIFPMQFCAIPNGSIITPESIGKHLSELLTHRCDIRNSQIAISIEKMLPDEDFSKYEDSPASLILNLLYAQQVYLPKAWDKLLYQADSLNINKNTEYLKTYFEQTSNDKYILISVLASSTKFYTFTSTILVWKDKLFVTEVADTLKEYESLEQLEEDIIFTKEHLHSNEDAAHSDSINIYTYKYNQLYQPSEIKDIHIVSYTSFEKELASAIQTHNKESIKNLFLNRSKYSQQFSSVLDDSMEINIDNYYNVILENTLNDIMHLEEKKGFTITNRPALLNNVISKNSNLYCIFLSFKIKHEQEIYTIQASAILVDNKWKLYYISPPYREEKLKFQF